MNLERLGADDHMIEVLWKDSDTGAELLLVQAPSTSLKEYLWWAPNGTSFEAVQSAARRYAKEKGVITPWTTQITQIGDWYRQQLARWPDEIVAGYLEELRQR